MNDVYAAFFDHLQRLTTSNRWALAELRNSLSFPLGTNPQIFSYVEPFLANDKSQSTPHRLAHYLVAGLFALHSKQQPTTLSMAMGMLYRKKEQSPSIERRFMALLESDAETIANPLRHCVALLRVHDLAIDYRALLTDLTIWFNPTQFNELDKLRRCWANDFYHAAP